MHICAWTDVYQDRYGDEYPQHHVAVCDDDTGEPTGTIYNCSTIAAGRSLGERMGRDRGLEFVDEMLRWSADF